MKLSELSTDEALDVLCEITPFVSNIVTDDSVMETVGKAVKKEGMTKAGVMLLGLEKFNKIVPILLKTHRPDVYGILSIVNGVDVGIISKQNIMKTATQIREIFQDEELISFFKSCVQQGKKE